MSSFDGALNVRPRRLLCQPLRSIAFGRWGAQRAQDRVARPALWVADARAPGRDAAQEDGQASLGELAATLAATSEQVAAAMARPPYTLAKDEPVTARLPRRA